MLCNPGTLSIIVKFGLVLICWRSSSTHAYWYDCGDYAYAAQLRHYWYSCTSGTSSYLVQLKQSKQTTHSPCKTLKVFPFCCFVLCEPGTYHIYTTHARNNIPWNSGTYWFRCKSGTHWDLCNSGRPSLLCNAGTYSYFYKPATYSFDSSVCCVVVTLTHVHM